MGVRKRRKPERVGKPSSATAGRITLRHYAEKLAAAAPGDVKETNLRKQDER